MRRCESFIILLITKFLFSVEMGMTEDSISYSFSSADNQGFPCIYKGIPYMHSDSWKIDLCTTCACDNATTTCVIESCQAAFCAEPIKPEGECCFFCPFGEYTK